MLVTDGIQLFKKENGKFEFQAITQVPSIFVLSQNALPGWEVKVDDEEIVPRTFGNVFLAVPLEKGIHTLKFEYKYGKLWQELWNLASIHIKK